jgi:hypothetical protein
MIYPWRINGTFCRHEEMAGVSLSPVKKEAEEDGVRWERSTENGCLRGYIYK